jgi:hypothetical protein
MQSFPASASSLFGPNKYPQKHVLKRANLCHLLMNTVATCCAVLISVSTTPVYIHCSLIIYYTFLPFNHIYMSPSTIGCTVLTLHCTLFTVDIFSAFGLYIFGCNVVIYVLVSMLKHLNC